MKTLWQRAPNRRASDCSLMGSPIWVTSLALHEKILRQRRVRGARAELFGARVRCYSEESLSVIDHLTAEERLSIELEQHVGHWVAVRNHEIVGVGSTLHELRAQVADQRIDRLFEVPDETGAAFF
jgi:hypothetical protein